MKNLTTIITAIFLLTSITTAQNYSLSFDGNDDYVNVGNTSSLTISGDITVSAWVYFDDFNTTLPNVISKITDGSNVSYGIEKNLNESRLSFWIGDGTDFVEAISGVLSATTWYHVVGTNDGTNSKIYINGDLEATVAQGNPAGPTGDLKIGLCSTQSQSYRYWDGLIDEVAIWNDALTADEITALYNSGNGLDASSNSGNYTSSSNLQGYWKFNEGSGTTLTDQTSNGNDGTINGATWSTDVPPTSGGNNALSFDGNDYVTIPHSSSFINNTISISVWVYLDTAPSSSESYLLFKGTDTGSPYTDRYWGLRLSGGSNMHVDGEFVISGSYYIISSNSVSLDTGNWHHILLTYDGSEIKLIIDSIEVNSLSASGTLSSGSDNVLLAYMPPVGYHFSGYLDAVSLGQGNIKQ